MRQRDVAAQLSAFKWKLRLAAVPELTRLVARGRVKQARFMWSALGLLVDRLLARRERRGRALRAVVISARLLAGGGWRERVVFRQALSDPQRIRLALWVRLQLLPAPAASLGLSVDSFGGAAGEQGELLADHGSTRTERLREAIAQVRAVAGADAALRAICVDPDSRVPERRVMLARLPG